MKHLLHDFRIGATVDVPPPEIVLFRRIFVL